KQIAFTSRQFLYGKAADGSGSEQRLTQTDFAGFPSSWSADGTFLAFAAIAPGARRDIWMLPMHGDHRKPEPWLTTPFNESAPQFSSDGHWVAYVSNESGRYEVYVRPLEGPGGKWQISSDGGSEPVWAHSGRELFYRNADKMMVVDVAIRPAFSASKP